MCRSRSVECALRAVDNRIPASKLPANNPRNTKLGNFDVAWSYRIQSNLDPHFVTLPRAS